MNVYHGIFFWLLGGACESALTHWRGEPAPLWLLWLDAVILLVLAMMASREARQ